MLSKKFNSFSNKRFSRFCPFFPKYGNLIALSCIFLVIFSLLSPSYLQGQNSNKLLCKCVVFRLDDVQDRFLNKTQLAIMNLFLQKNQSLSLGLIMNHVGNDTTLLNKIREGLGSGLFELGLHGWNHENFTQVSEENQIALMLKSNEKLQSLFGSASLIFIPPSFDFNNSTLDAMQKSGIQIISSWDNFYKDKNLTDLITFGAQSNNMNEKKIFHFPTTIQYSYFDRTNWVTYPVQKVLVDVDKSFSKYGYAVITLHPQALSITGSDGNFINSVNATKLSNLETLLDKITSQNIPIKSFYDLSGIPSDQIIKSNSSHHNVNIPIIGK